MKETIGIRRMVSLIHEGCIFHCRFFPTLAEKTYNQKWIQKKWTLLRFDFLYTLTWVCTICLYSFLYCVLLLDLILVARNIFDEDNYTPILCEDESQYSATLKEFPFEDSELQVLWLLWAAFGENDATIYCYYGNRT